MIKKIKYKIADFKENFEKVILSKFSNENFAQISSGNRNYAKFSKKIAGILKTKVSGQEFKDEVRKGWKDNIENFEI